MATSNLTKGRGHGRGRMIETNVKYKVHNEDASIVETPSTIGNLSLVTPTSDCSSSSSSPSSKRNDSRPDTGISSIRGSLLLATPSSIIVPVGRGRGRGRGRGLNTYTDTPNSPSLTPISRNEIDNPTINGNASVTDAAQYKVDCSPMTHQESFQSLGSIGEEIQVLSNYFAIDKYPEQGIVYEYAIEIKTPMGRDAHRHIRRYVLSHFIVDHILFIPFQ
jgi:hypothetical protein